MSVRSGSLFGGCVCWCVRIEIQAQVRQTVGTAPSSHQESSPCQTPKNPGLEMKQRGVCIGVYMYVLCAYEPCASMARLRLILTFPTGAGVNKSANRSRCGE